VGLEVWWLGRCGDLHGEVWWKGTCGRLRCGGWGRCVGMADWAGRDVVGKDV
jgi:hypothetical protein